MIYSFKNIEFDYPWLLFSLCLIPIIILSYIKRNKRQRAFLFITSIEHIKEKRLSSFYIPFMLRCLSLVFLFLALARPQQIYSKKYLEGEAIDIMLCFDISWSMVDTTMIEQGFIPNRFAVSKQLASDFVRQRAGDKIGVVFFSNNGFLACPLTTDTSAVLSQIRNLNPEFVMEEGTSIGMGVAVSVNRLSRSDSKTKIILLLSDGENNGGFMSPDASAFLAKKYGIRIYCIGIGSQKNVAAKRFTPFGSEEDYIKPLYFNDSLLKFIAKETKGRFFHALNKESLKESYESINTLEKSKIKKLVDEEIVEKYSDFLLIALALLFLEVVLKYIVFKKFP